MALVLRGVAENSAANGANVTVTHPGGVAAGDVVYFAYAIGDNDNVDQNMAMVTAGYTELADLFKQRPASNDDSDLGVYRKIMGGTPDSTAVGTGLGGTDASVAAVEQVWTGADQTTPEDATTTTGTSLDATQSPAIVTATANAIVLTIVGATLQDTTVTAPTGYSDQVDRDQLDTTNVTLGMASKLVASPGTETPGAWTTWTSGAACMATVAIMPAPDVGHPAWARWGGVKHMGGRRTGASVGMW